MHHTKKGYILILVLVIISLSMMIATYLANKGLVFNSFTKTMIAREHAQQLALSGIQLALAQLYVPKETAEKKEGQKPPSPAEQELAQNKKLLATLLAHLGKWQTVTLKKNTDGIDGTIRYCIMAEEGKINLNQYFDFQAGKVKQEYEKFLQDIFEGIKKQKGGDSLYPKVINFLKKRGYPLNDISELMTLEGFDSFKNTLWYDPDIKKDAKIPLSLYDLFTVYTGTSKLDPWLLSQSVAQILFKVERKDVAKNAGELAAKLKPQHAWQTDWQERIRPIYGKEYNQVPKEVYPLLKTAFSPRTFSVMSVGIYNNVSYRLYAIIERTKEGDQVSMQIRDVYVL